MNIYKLETETEIEGVITKSIQEISLEDKDFLLITAIDNLTTQLKILGNKL